MHIRQDSNRSKILSTISHIGSQSLLAQQQKYISENKSNLSNANQSSAKRLKRTNKSESLPILLPKYYDSSTNKLLPKHLVISHRKKGNLHKNMKYEQTVAQQIKRNKTIMIKPLNDIQLIMDKFDEVIQSKRSVRDTPRHITKQQLRMQKRGQSELQKRIVNLLALPTVHRIKQKAAVYRMQTQPISPEILFSQSQRLSILRKYEQFVKNSGTIAQKRVLTLQNS